MAPRRLASVRCFAASSAAVSYTHLDVYKRQPLYGAAQEAIEKQDYAAALPLLQQVTSQEPQNADAWNLLGFSNRKLGNMDQAAAAYDTALRINPAHLGALEYQGAVSYTHLDVYKRQA